ncbi:hypothetical protein Tco_1225433, partial [Tanacetum coccineum]
MVSRRLELFLVVMIIVISILASSEATRLLTEDDWLDKYERLLKHRLPRGPVPPSGPSLCHNALGLYKQSEFAFDTISSLFGCGTSSKVFCVVLSRAVPGDLHNQEAE